VTMDSVSGGVAGNGGEGKKERKIHEGETKSVIVGKTEQLTRRF